MEDICSSVKSINVKFHTGTLEIDGYIVSNIILGRLWRENSRLFRTKVFFLLFSNLTLLNTVSIIIKLQKCRNLQGHATIPFMKTGQNMKGKRLSIFELVVWSRLQLFLSSMSRRKRVKIYPMA